MPTYARLVVGVGRARFTERRSPNKYMFNLLLFLWAVVDDFHVLFRWFLRGNVREEMQAMPDKQRRSHHKQRVLFARGVYSFDRPAPGLRRGVIISTFRAETSAPCWKVCCLFKIAHIRNHVVSPKCDRRTFEQTRSPANATGVLVTRQKLGASRHPLSARPSRKCALEPEHLLNSLNEPTHAPE